MLLSIVTFLVKFGTFQDELLKPSIHLPPIWKSRENLLAVWIGLAFLFHALFAFLVRRFDYEWQCTYYWRQMATMKKEMCPHRRARFMKCYRRRQKKEELNEQQQQQQQETGDWTCPFETSFWRLQMPPPLPLRKHKRPNYNCCSKVSTTSSPSPPASSTETIKEITKEERMESGSSKPSSESVLEPITKILMPAPPVVRTSLIDLARMQHWDTLKAQVNRREAKHHDADGLYPLHWACSGSPPPDVIKGLLKAYHSAARKADSEGSLALHFAAHYGASANVVEIVLNAYEPAIRWQDKYGRTPLFHAVAKAAGLEVLRILVTADPSMVTTPCLPPDKAKKNVHLRANWVKRTPLYLSWAAVLSDRQARQRRAGKVWDKAQLLSEAAFNLYRDLRPSVSRTYRVLHSAVSMDSLLPPGVVELAIQARPDQLQEADDTDGRLPLAVAASTPHASASRSDTLIKLLLEAFPAATRILDAKGRTPLMLATLSGKTWEAGVGRLVAADPDVIDWRDPVTGLYPASLAATAVAGETLHVEDDVSESTEEEEEVVCLLPAKALEKLRRESDSDSSSLSSSSLSCCSSSFYESDTPSQRVSTIYQLLQANPSIIS